MTEIYNKERITILKDLLVELAAAAINDRIMLQRKYDAIFQSTYIKANADQVFSLINKISVMEHIEKACKDLLKFISSPYFTGDQTVRPPRLDHTIFNAPGCPTWAKYAVVNRFGVVHVFNKKPYSYKNQWCSKTKGKHAILSAVCDNSDWKNSMITKLPDWVKVGATVFHKQDKKLYKITEIHPNTIETEMIKESGRTVRLQDPETFLKNHKFYTPEKESN